MAGEKSIPLGLRVSPRFKTLLELAAQKDHRSQTNMLEHLLYKHCAEHGIKEQDAAANNPPNSKEKNQ